MGKKKKIAKYDKLLRKYKKKREVVKINRTVTDGEANIYGLILELSEDFMQLNAIAEFRFNGEIIIRMDHYDSIRCSPFEKASKHILIKEKRFSKSKPKGTSVNLTTWESIFKDLKKMNIHTIIECEDLKEPAFYIGSIEKVNSNSVEIRNYDATGRIDKKAAKIKFKNITLVKFNDEYSTIFRRYLKEPKKKKVK